MGSDKVGGKQSRGRETQADIINVTRQLFSEHGYHGTGISDIQDATGLTKGAFYHHFATKEELALAVLETTEADYAEQLFRPVLAEPTPTRRVVAMFDGICSLNEQPEWCNCRMLMTLSAELTAADPRLRETVAQMRTNAFELWQRLLEEAQEAGELNEDIEPSLWAQWIMNTLVGALAASKLDTQEVPVTEIVSLMKRLLIKPDVLDEIEPSKTGGAQ